MTALRTSMETLDNARSQVHDRYRDAKDVWHDETERHFTEQFWIPAEKLTRNTAAALDRLSQAIDKALRDCQNL